jgi:aryl-alcohol dehydrogenase-like predicted oxidoreductase
MEYRRLGRSGLKVSRIALGCMMFGDAGRGYPDFTLSENESRPLLRAAIEAGVNFLDTSNGYSSGHSEEIVGRAVRDFSRREDVVIATKVFAPMRPSPLSGGLSRREIVGEVERSLDRLGTDYIDLYQAHRWDPETPIEEILLAFDQLVRDGKVRYLGASSMYAWKFAQALTMAGERGWHRFVSMQNHLNLLYREEEREMLPLCLEQGIGVVPWSPLARGRLARPADTQVLSARQQTDRFADHLYGKGDEADRQIIQAVGVVAEQLGISRSEVALAWLYQKPEVTAPLLGVGKLQHLEDALKALEVTLPPEAIAALEAPYVSKPVSGIN